MLNNRFRIYYGPDSFTESTSVLRKTADQSVTVPAGEIFAAIADAIYNNRAWLHDFEDEEVSISRDLYEVIMAYEHLRRPSA